MVHTKETSQVENVVPCLPVSCFLYESLHVSINVPFGQNTKTISKIKFRDLKRIKSPCFKIRIKVNPTLEQTLHLKGFSWRWTVETCVFNTSTRPNACNSTRCSKIELMLRWYCCVP